MAINLDAFIKGFMRQGERHIPARLEAALAFLERLREEPLLQFKSHVTNSGASLISHETFGKRAHIRFELDKINENYGRRSNNLNEWGPKLLDTLREAGFESLTESQRDALISEAQKQMVQHIRSILEQEPLEARLKGRSAEAVIRDILKQAEAKGKTGDVAQYLVGAKLNLRLNREIPVVGSNLGDRRSRGDAQARTGDFEIENTTIEVAVGLPDEKHLAQVVEALEDTDLEVWLLTRHDRVASWQHELQEFEGVDAKRVVVTSVESFVGQNISEMGGFSVKGKASQLQALFKLYNDRWIAQVGTPGIRIIVK